MMFRRCVLLLLSYLAAWPAIAGAAQISVKQTPQGARVEADGQLFTEYLTKSGAKPILWPVNGPAGTPLTRSYPLKEVPGEERDHVHQRSLWFTHGEVNGIDFWSEETGHGSIEHREFVKLQGGDEGIIVTRNDWLAPDGRRQCQDERTLIFKAGEDWRAIDFTAIVHASDGTVKFGDTKEGSFGVRVASSMRVDAKQGGKIVNSQCQTDDVAWGKPAAWVDYHGPVEGRQAGIAILNHPSSFRYPTSWHVRTYGLFAANPFGRQAFGGDTDGAYTLAKGESFTLRYLVVLHDGDEKSAHIPDVFAQFSKN